MKNKFLIVLNILLIALATSVAVRELGTLSTTIEDKTTYFTLSTHSLDSNYTVSVQFFDEENRKQIKKIQAIKSGNAIHSFAFPESNEIRNLRIQIQGVDQLEINGLDLSSNAFSKSFSHSEITKDFQLTGAHPIKSEHKLVLKNEQPQLIQFKYKGTIHTQTSHFLTCFAIVGGALFLSLILLIFLIRRKSMTTFFSGFLLSMIISVAFYYTLENLREDLKNIKLQMNIHGLEKGETCELYYSPTIGFQAERILTDTLSATQNQQLNYVFPDFLNRYIRIDFPKNKTIKIKTVNIEHWLGIEKLSGQAIPKSFNLRNDLEILNQDNSSITIKTGSNDPYFILSDDHLQSNLTVSQLQKWKYPSWFSLILFCLLLFFLSTSQQVKERFFISLFLIFIFIPITTMILKRDVVTLANEKRNAYQKPTFEGHLLNKTPQEVTQYLEDQFGGRTGFTTTWNALRVLSFNQASKSGPVIIGKEGWMFYVGDDVREVFENKNPLTEEKLAQMTKVLNERHEWLKSYGIKYYLVIPPLKKTMYPEYLPARLYLHHKISKLDQFLNYLKTHSEANVIDLRPALLVAKKKEKFPIYYKYDTHWNLLGGFYGYQEVMKYLQRDFPGIFEPSKRSDFKWSFSTNTDGDLVKLLSINTIYRRTEIVPVPKKGYKAGEIPSLSYASYESPHPIVTYSNPDSVLPKMIMNRDSYSNFLIPFMSEHFSRSIYLWTPKFNAEIIKEEMPEVVISEMLERFIQDLSIENPAIVTDELRKLKQSKK